MSDQPTAPFLPASVPTAELPVTATATFCATIVDQWVEMGLGEAFIAPGSRSTPLALALVANDDVRCNVFHDERSASFACLGNGLASGVPAVLLCTSGTAATHFHGAVAEADASDVPMLVCTADRPPELWGIGAPQTIDQTQLYGGAVRWFAEPGPPDDEGADPASWRPLAAEAFRRATGATDRPGPVHLNLSFRDPLVGAPGLLPARIETIEEDGSEVEFTLPDLLGRTGVIVAGRSPADPADVLRLGEALGWPVLADHRSGCRVPGGALNHHDTLLRSPEFAQRQRPEVILRIGEPLSSKVLGQWITACAADGTEVVALTDRAKRIDPERVATQILPVTPVLPLLIDVAVAAADPVDAAGEWRRADDAVRSRIDDLIESGPDGSEPAVARAAVSALPDGGALVVSSSMPVRDVEWYGPNRNGLTVYSNRGANGIDGVTSTAIGVALTGTPTVCLIGDVAFLHDTNALIALRHRVIDLTIVVVDNDGGGIFSFLPQHELLPSETYELLFGTPHGTDLEALCRAHGLALEEWRGAIGAPAGLRVVLARTDRAANLELHRNLSLSGPDPS